MTVARAPEIEVRSASSPVRPLLVYSRHAMCGIRGRGRGPRNGPLEGGALDWYYASEEGKPVGPVSDEEFRTLVAQGKIGPGTLVQGAGMGKWEPWTLLVRRLAAGSGSPLPPLAEAALDDSALTCVSCGRPIGSGAESFAAATGVLCSPCHAFATSDTARVPRVAPAAVMGMVCVSCRRPVTENEAVRYSGHWICGPCKPAFFQRVREGLPAVQQMVYAGFWPRFAAKIVDSFILFAVMMILNVFLLVLPIALLTSSGGRSGAGPPAGLFVFMCVYYLVAFSVPILYNWWFVQRFGATLGKMALHIKVVMADGSPVSNGRAWGRAFADLLSQMSLYIGYIIAAFDEENRALHDHICSTRVVKT